MAADALHAPEGPPGLALMRAGHVIAGRFVIEAPIGSGGMGLVYRAHDRALGRPVAVKVLRRPEPGAEARFAREAELLERLVHPAIVGFVDRGTTETGDPYLAMEWLQGETLSERLRRGPLAPLEVVPLAQRLAAAMQAAHDLGIVHRDLKPSNLFLVGGSLEGVRVLDFGIARLLEPGRRLTATGELIGTPGYLSPEQVRGDPNVDARTDVFALGCVLYRALSGRSAFDASDGVASILRVLVDTPAPLAEVAPHTPAPLAALVHRMLEKDPARRPAHGGALAAELAALQGGGGSALPWPATGATPASQVAGGGDGAAGGAQQHRAVRSACGSASAPARCSRSSPSRSSRSSSGAG
jgi:serine/threonine protein kinase